MPPEVEWVKNTLGDMSYVKDNEIDLVFAGQTIEHMWPNDLASFLCETYRVLKPNGLIVLDSPNRRITRALHWFQPQHTMELSVDEIVFALETAGFYDVKVKGVWLCYDKDQHRFLPLEPNSKKSWLSYEKRIELSKDRPEDCFVWWVEAHKSNQKPNKTKIQDRLNEIFVQVFSYRLSELKHNIGTIYYVGNKKLIRCSRNEKGALIYGPYIPLKNGKYQVDFFIKCDEDTKNNDEVCFIDVYNQQEDKLLAKRIIKFSELSSAIYTKQSLLFSLEDTKFGIEFRMFSTGLCPLSAYFAIELHNPP